jgi:hypothetical protein
VWIGWLWTGERWQDVAEGRTLSACSRRLDAEASVRGVRHNLYRGLTGGLPPTWRPADAPAGPQAAPAELEGI